VWGATPPETLAVQETGWPKRAGEGEPEQETTGPTPEVILRVNWVVLEGPPVADPTTVMVWLPKTAEPEAVKVMVDEQVGVHGLPETENETPEGTPETFRSTED